MATTIGQQIRTQGIKVRDNVLRSDWLLDASANGNA